MNLLEASIVWGSHNIFTVRDLFGTIHENLRIKGKLLEIDEEAHNPLAPGDRVEIEDSGSGFVIASRLERRNAVTRWNRKRRRLQTVAANVDWLYIVANAGEPHYRPQFVDRVLVMAELASIDAAIILNKADLPLPEDAHLHLSILRNAGYPVLPAVSVGTVDVVEVREHSRGSIVCLIGQSGVGKSSLVNALVPGTKQRVGVVSPRYRRGRHTTTLAKQVLLPEDGTTVYVDTPGIREFDLFGYDVNRIDHGFREFRQYIDHCELQDCSHTHEPGCALRDAAESDRDIGRRYRSYLSILSDLREQESSTP